MHTPELTLSISLPPFLLKLVFRGRARNQQLESRKDKLDPCSPQIDGTPQQLRENHAEQGGGIS